MDQYPEAVGALLRPLVLLVGERAADLAASGEAIKFVICRDADDLAIPALPSVTKPGGLLKVGWAAKRQSTRPAVVVSVVTRADLAEAEGTGGGWARTSAALARAAQLAARIRAKPAVLVVAAEGEGALPDALAAAAARAASADPAAVLAADPGDARSTATARAALLSLARRQYARDVSERLAAFAQDPPTQHRRLQAVFKAAVLEELQGEWAHAARSYREAYSACSRLSIGPPSPVQRFVEVRDAAEVLHVKLLLIQLLCLRRVPEGAAQIALHLQLFRKLPVAAPAPVRAAHAAWAARQLLVGAQLLHKSTSAQPSPAGAPGPATDPARAAGGAETGIGGAGAGAGAEGGGAAAGGSPAAAGAAEATSLPLQSRPARLALAAAEAAIEAEEALRTQDPDDYVRLPGPVAETEWVGQVALVGATRRLDDDEYAAWLLSRQPLPTTSSFPSLRLLRDACAPSSPAARDPRTFLELRALLGQELLRAGRTREARAALAAVAADYRRLGSREPLQSVLGLLTSVASQLGDARDSALHRLELAALSSLAAADASSPALPTPSLLDDDTPSLLAQYSEPDLAGTPRAGPEAREPADSSAAPAHADISPPWSSGWWTIAPLAATLGAPRAQRAPRRAAAPARPPAPRPPPAPAAVLRLAWWLNLSSPVSVASVNAVLRDSSGCEHPVPCSLLPSSSVAPPPAPDGPPASAGAGGAAVALTPSRWTVFGGRVVRAPPGPLRLVEVTLELAGGVRLRYDATTFPPEAFGRPWGDAPGGFSASLPARALATPGCSINPSEVALPQRHSPPVFSVHAPRVGLQGEAVPLALVIRADELSGLVSGAVAVRAAAQGTGAPVRVRSSSGRGSAGNDGELPIPPLAPGERHVLPLRLIATAPGVVLVRARLSYVASDGEGGLERAECLLSAALPVEAPLRIDASVVGGAGWHVLVRAADASGGDPAGSAENAGREASSEGGAAAPPVAPPAFALPTGRPVQLRVTVSSVASCALHVDRVEFLPPAKADGPEGSARGLSATQLLGPRGCAGTLERTGDALAEAVTLRGLRPLALASLGKVEVEWRRHGRIEGRAVAARGAEPVDAAVGGPAPELRPAPASVTVASLASAAFAPAALEASLDAPERGVFGEAMAATLRLRNGTERGHDARIRVGDTADLLLSGPRAVTLHVPAGSDEALSIDLVPTTVGPLALPSIDVAVGGWSVNAAGGLSVFVEKAGGWGWREREAAAGRRPAAEPASAAEPARPDAVGGPAEALGRDSEPDGAPAPAPAQAALVGGAPQPALDLLSGEESGSPALAVSLGELRLEAEPAGSTGPARESEPGSASEPAAATEGRAAPGTEPPGPEGDSGVPAPSLGPALGPTFPSEARFSDVPESEGDAAPSRAAYRPEDAAPSEGAEGARSDDGDVDALFGSVSPATSEGEGGEGAEPLEEEGGEGGEGEATPGATPTAGERAGAAIAAAAFPGTLLDGLEVAGLRGGLDDAAPVSPSLPPKLELEDGEGEEEAVPEGSALPLVESEPRAEPPLPRPESPTPAEPVFELGDPIGEDRAEV